jgi:hypothetical protein
MLRRLDEMMLYRLAKEYSTSQFMRLRIIKRFLSLSTREYTLE